MTEEAAARFAEEWIASWNAHDLDRVLSHYTDDFEMSSPYITPFAGEPSGTLKGKAQIGSYWRKALERIPDLHFEITEIFVGAASVAITYNAAWGRRATEVFFFNADGKVYKATALYRD